MNANELIEAYVDDVVRRLDRKRRNDVGVELRALLGDELQELSGTAGRPADEAMAMALLRRFGRPEDVAARYRAPGFPIIEAADAPAFVKLSAIGMGLVWIVGLFVIFRDGGGLERLSRWWMTFGLGAFWWPGFLVVCSGIAGWIRRQFPVTDEWKPRVLDRDRINRPAWVLAIAWIILGTIWLTSPAFFVEQLTGGRLAPEFYRTLMYNESFRQWRLPLLLMLLTGQLVVYAVLVARGRWERTTRRLEMILTAATSALLIWSLAAGRIFQSEVSNRIAGSVIVVVVVIAIWDIATKVYREFARVRMPASLAR
jgi:hypothetical protein